MPINNAFAVRSPDRIANYFASFSKLIARQISHYNFIYGLVFYDCCTYNYTIILLGTEIVLILAYLFLQHVSTLSFVDHPFP